MAIPSQEIGKSQKAKLLWQISKQLENLTGIMGSIEVGPVDPTTTTTTSSSSTTTTTTTAAPGPTPSYTGTIDVDTTTPGNEYFNFRMLTQDNGQSTSIVINWGDNTAETYDLVADSNVYFAHTYSSNDNWVVTVQLPNPAQINTIDLDRSNNESNAIVTGYSFRNFNGINQLIVGNNDALHIAATTGLTTLVTFQATNADLESLSLVDADDLTSLTVDNNNLSVLDLTTAPSLQYVNLTDNELIGIDISDSANITYLDLTNNAFSEIGVDNILLSLVQNNKNYGTVNLTGPANDAPSQTGLGAKATLESRGWTVNVNTSSGIKTKLMYYVPGYSYSVKNSMFLNTYYFNNNVNKYTKWYINNQPKTVYYAGTFGPNVTLYTNPELTEFLVNEASNWSYFVAVFVDATLSETSVSGDISIYSFNQYTGVILNELGTVADSTFTSQQIRRAQNPLTYCDNNNQWNGGYAYYPPGQNGPVVNGYAFSDINSYNGTGNNAGDLVPIFKQGDDATTVYSIQYNGLITAVNPCTYVPTWNASWGATVQEAIDGTNPISIKPLSGNSMLTTNSIRKADNTYFDTLPNLFYIAYDGLVKAFDNGYSEAYWNGSYPTQSIAPPPTTPFEIVLLKTSCCSCFTDPNYESQKFTAYSNFPSLGTGTPVYKDAALTIPLDIYEYYTTGSVYFNCYDRAWPYILYTC